MSARQSVVLVAAIVLLLAAAMQPAHAVDKADIDRLLNHPFYGYNIIIQIDKGAPGTSLHAQRVRVHRYHPETGSLEFIGRWYASTGAETPEIDIKGRVAKRVTHAGFYDVNMLELDAYSDAWDGPMPFAVYWDYAQGFAIHATENFNYFKLGRRASAGCTRLQLENAIKLYDMVEAEGKGLTLKLDRHTGKPVYKSDGSPVVQRGYKAMVLIEDGGSLEPTRLGFLPRSVVFSSLEAYQGYMTPPITSALPDRPNAAKTADQPNPAAPGSGEFEGIPADYFSEGPITGEELDGISSPPTGKTKGKPLGNGAKLDQLDGNRSYKEAAKKY